jgi:hypothetical protein
MQAECDHRPIAVLFSEKGSPCTSLESSGGDSVVRTEIPIPTGMSIPRKDEIIW